MPEDLMAEYARARNDLGSTEYLMHLIGYHFAPVQQRVKPAVVLTFVNERRRPLRDAWLDQAEKIPRHAGFDFHPLQQTPERVIVLFFHPELLQETLENPECVDFLKHCGYNTPLTPESALATLASRYRCRGCPHEIGIFLGIPLPDVLGFIVNGGKQAVAEGYWKIYEDPGPKLALFARFQEAKRCFIRFVMAGNAPQDYLGEKSLALAD